MKSNRNKRGFTLIELLIVILIIGILAAVALPRYQRAVKKSRFAGLQTTAQSLAKHAQTYYLEHGYWPTDFDELDVLLPTNMNSSTFGHVKCRYNDKFYCCMGYPVQHTNSGSIGCGLADFSIVYTTSYADTNGSIQFPLPRSCYQKPDAGVCEFVPGASKISSSANIYTPVGWEKGGYERYSL